MPQKLINKLKKNQVLEKGCEQGVEKKSVSDQKKAKKKCYSMSCT